MWRKPLVLRCNGNNELQYWNVRHAAWLTVAPIMMVQVQFAIRGLSSKALYELSDDLNQIADRMEGKA